VLAGGCAPAVTERLPSRGDEPTVGIWVLDHGWHTAIVVRRADVERALWPEVDDFPEATFVEVALGDRDFYMATPPSAWLAIKAAIRTSGSVLHVVGFNSPPATSFLGAEIVELRLPPPGFAALTRFVSDEYQRDEARRPVRLAPGLHGASWFYAARSPYHLFNTCNTWVARALQAGGLPVTPAGTVTAGGVMQQVREAARAGAAR
jgi:uncharacterized protein (TIGR02117 family)